MPEKSISIPTQLCRLNVTVICKFNRYLINNSELT